MIKLRNSINAFIALLKAGLWEKEVRLLAFGEIDYSEVYWLAERQSVTGLVAAGLEKISDKKTHQKDVLRYVGSALKMEHMNSEMNSFISSLVDKMRKDGIYVVMVKGQGVAQCYERPLWRTISGDVDFLLSEENYKNAKKFLSPLASSSKPERIYSKEVGYYIGNRLVELHGTLHTGLSARIDKTLEYVQKDVLCEGNVRSWNNNRTTVFLPSPDNDAFIIFTHFIKHFYKEGGIRLRQLCDWCRLLWTYRKELNEDLLECRLLQAGLMSEWKAFAALAVDYLGMPKDNMPLYTEKKKWHKKGDRILTFILKKGKWRKIHDTIAVGGIFPMGVLRFFPGIFLNVNRLKIKERLESHLNVWSIHN